jgi:YggT family protein
MFTRPLLFLVDVAFGLVVYPLLLRFYMQWLRAPFRNPLGMAVHALTDWLVKPLRRIVPGVRGVDWATVIAAYVSQFLWVLALYFAFGRGFALFGPGLPFLAITAVIALFKALLWLAIIVVFAQALLSWIAPDGPLAGVLNALTFPLLRPIRRLVPPIGGTLDLSPLIVIVLAQLVLITLVPWLESAATALFL